MSSDTQAAPTVVQKARIVCGIILGFTVVYAVVGFALVLFDVMPSGGYMDVSENIGVALNGMMIVAGILSAGASFPLKRVLASRIDPERPGGPSRFQVALISMAMAETGGVLGLVAVLLTGELGAAGILWGVAVGAGVFHFPTRAWLEGEV
ncbi:MAG: hypothetical protein IID08_00390 [Candidatus Hydrogenedentes bacterium]|nr:hypothetical protein [Candidatus Hydrogenedentota bacterium]